MIKINKDRLNEFLKFRRWRKTDLADAMGFSEAYITRLLNGERAPSLPVMEKLANITNLPLGELFFCLDTYKKVGMMKNPLKCSRRSVPPLKRVSAHAGGVRASEGGFRFKKRHSCV